MKKVFIKDIHRNIVMFHVFTITKLSSGLNSKKFSQRQISQQSSTVVWRYKYIDGKLYKRQYNTATDVWIGSWIPA